MMKPTKQKKFRRINRRFASIKRNSLIGKNRVFGLIYIKVTKNINIWFMFPIKWQDSDDVELNIQRLIQLFLKCCFWLIAFYWEKKRQQIIIYKSNQRQLCHRQAYMQILEVGKRRIKRVALNAKDTNIRSDKIKMFNNWAMVAWAIHIVAHNNID